MPLSLMVLLLVLQGVLGCFAEVTYTVMRCDRTPALQGMVALLPFELSSRTSV